MLQPFTLSPSERRTIARLLIDVVADDAKSAIGASAKECLHIIQIPLPPDLESIQEHAELVRDESTDGGVVQAANDVIALVDWCRFKEEEYEQRRDTDRLRIGELGEEIHKLQDKIREMEENITVATPMYQRPESTILDSVIATARKLHYELTGVYAADNRDPKCTFNVTARKFVHKAAHATLWLVGSDAWFTESEFNEKFKVRGALKPQ